MKITNRKSGFTLIEILIVITIIGILAALVAGALGSFGGAKSRDAVRLSNLNQVATMVSSMQNRFHIPPLSDKQGKYPADCKKEGGTLQKCLIALKVMPERDLYEVLTDPKQDAAIANKTFQYYYVASTDGFKVCAHMEDQGAFENMNATDTGVLSTSLTAGDATAYMHCVVHGKGVDSTVAEAITVTEPTAPSE